MQKFEFGDVVELSPQSEYWNVDDKKHPTKTRGEVIDVVLVDGRVPYTVKWDNGEISEYGTLDLKHLEKESEGSQGFVSKERAERVVPFKVVTGSKQDNNDKEMSDEEYEQQQTRYYIKKFMEDYKEYFDDIVIVGSTDNNGMELMMAGLTPPEAYFALQAAAHQLMQQIMYADGDEE